jgi:hypothetical protein
MKNVFRVALLLMVCGTSSSTYSQNHDAPTISKFIAGQAAQERGEEYRGARKVISGDLNHDGTPDVTVLYTLEGFGGGNNYTQYLAIFVRDPATHGLTPVAHKTVGGKLYREIALESIANNVVLCKTKDYAKQDASCCPSKKGTASFVLEGNTIKEQGDQVRKGPPNTPPAK